MKKLTQSLFALILTFCMAFANLPVTVMAEGTQAEGSGTGKTYYVSNDGNDSNDGLSEQTAWATLEKVNSTTFEPGDSILLKRGNQWNGQLWPKGSGTEGNYITLGAYGTGNRPIINGNGTGAAVLEAEKDKKDNPTNTQFVSGAVMLVDQEYWIIEGLEVTNLDKDYVSNKHGILVLNTCTTTESTEDSANILKGIRIRDCYVHDVDTLDIEDWDTPYQNYGTGDRHSNTQKMTGGITVLTWNAELDGQYINGKLKSKPRVGRTGGIHDVIIENNHVERVSKEGIRNKGTQLTASGSDAGYPKKNKDVIIRNNYIEKVFGDAIVLSEVVSGGLVEHNVVNGHTYSSSANYAGVWNHYSNDAVVQYNEVFNGNSAPTGGDGEAFDIDNSCYANIFQYNYSHNNAGGFILFMQSQWDSILRYNISANDAHKPQQQTLFYHTATNNNKRPKIYNNTFYIGKDTQVESLIYQSNASMDFQNNIVLAHGTLEKFAGTTLADSSVVRNNVIYPASIAYNSGLTEAQLAPENKNIFVEPKLVNVSKESTRQDDTLAFTVNKEKNPETFTNKEILRQRVAKYKLSNQSPQELKTGGVPVLDAGLGSGSFSGEANYPAPPTEDIFGSPVSHEVGSIVSIGAHQWVDAEENADYIAPDNVEVEKVEISKTTLKLATGDTETLTASAIGKNTADETLSDTSVTFTSSNKDVASVDGNGKVTALAKGTTVITATSNRDNTKKAECTVEVIVKELEAFTPNEITSYKGVYPTLPAEITVVYNTGAKEKVKVTWNDVPESDYIDTPVGESYTVKGTTTIGLSPEIKVNQVEKGEITKLVTTTTVDNYSQGGGTTDVNKLRVKGGTGSYSRQGYVKFNLDSIGFNKEEMKDAAIRLYIAGIDFASNYKSSKFNVYVLDDENSRNFTDDTGTTAFAEIPATIKVVDGMEVNYAASSKEDNSNVPEYIDVYVGDALKYADSENNITFKITCEEPPTTTNIDNSGIEFYSRNYDSGSKAPKLFVTNNYVISASNPTGSITTQKGVQPTDLPKTVTVEYKSMNENNILTSLERKVTWDTATEEQLSKVGTFMLNGTVEGTDLKVQIKIVVTGDASDNLQYSVDEANKVLNESNPPVGKLIKSIADLSKAIKEYNE